MKKAKKSRAQAKRSVATAPVARVEKKMTSMEKPAAVTPFNWLVMFFVAFLVVHTLVMYAANMLFPQSVVLGTNTISSFTGLLYSMTVFTFITVGAMPVIESIQRSQNVKFSNTHWMVFYFAINFVGLWLVARFAEQLGLGLASWKVVAALAVVLDVAQGLVVKSMMPKMK
jgi:hypothetical protein